MCKTLSRVASSSAMQSYSYTVDMSKKNSSSRKIKRAFESERDLYRVLSYEKVSSPYSSYYKIFIGHGHHFCPKATQARWRFRSSSRVVSIVSVKLSKGRKATHFVMQACDFERPNMRVADFHLRCALGRCL